MLKFLVSHAAGHLLVHCSGQLRTGDELDLLCPATQSRGTLALEMNEVTAIEAAVVSGLITLRAAGTEVTIVNPSEAVCSALQKKDSEGMFEIIWIEDATQQKFTVSREVQMNPSLACCE